MKHVIFTICMVLLNGDLEKQVNCDWKLYVISEHQDYLSILEARGVAIEPELIQSGITMFDKKEMYVSELYMARLDQNYNDVITHEILHATLYEQAQLNYYQSMVMANDAGVPINMYSPWRYHD